MNNLFSKIVTFYNKYRIFLFPAIPFSFFVIFLILIIILLQEPKTSTNQNQNTTINTFPTSQSSPQPIQTIPLQNNPTPIKNTDTYDPEYAVTPEELGNVQKTEQLTDGSTKYTLLSPDQIHPNIVIVKNNEFVFRRTVNPPGDTQPIKPFITLYGNPDSVTDGSVYYGPSYKKYIYARLGFTLLVDTQTQMVVEQHMFISGTANEYISEFGNEDQ